jgi:UDP-N-acetylglucosamine/UDP-N-acetylgalactosamine diphosphorylase
MTDELKSRLEGILAPRGQQHVLAHWDDLSEDERAGLAEQIDSVDFGLIDRLVSEGTGGRRGEARIEPAEFIELPHDEPTHAQWERARAEGETAVNAGRVAAFVVAGGQGTRLGFDGPKGCFEIGPVTGRTLFRIHAEKVLAASKRAGTAIPFLVMTSRTNDAATRAYFEQNDHFGLDSDTVRIFRQAEMPAVDFDGRLVLDRPGHIFMSPNGHGGSLKALWDSGAIDWLERNGIDLISYFQVDNPLVKIIDPCFLGFHLLADARMSLKLLRRTRAEEKLGIWVRLEGRPRVIEYIDMPPDKMKARDETGGLLYPGGSIAINCLSTSFVRRLNEEGFALPFHRAKKKIPYLAADGSIVTPEEPNGTKFETFVFDALIFARSALGVQTAREEEFSPLKNAEGSDSPQTARRDMSRLYASWLKAAGVDVPTDSRGYPPFPIEISPLAADSAEALRENYAGPASIGSEFVFQP